MLLLMCVRQEHKSLSRRSWSTSLKTELCLPAGREFGPILPTAEFLLSLQNTLKLKRSEIHVC